MREELAVTESASPEINVIVEEIPALSLAGDNRLEFVISQPLLCLDKDSNPPFRITNSCRYEMLSYLEKSLDEATALQTSSRMLIFPEYSVPLDNPDGVGMLLQWMRDGPNDTVIVAGLESLNEGALQRIELLLPSPKSNIRAQDLQGNKFANCCLILIKTREGVVRSYLQAKLRPSEQEDQTLRMVGGDSIFFFRTGRFNFVVLICFDLISSEANRLVIVDLIAKLGSCAARSDECINLHALINIQYNPKPTHPAFIDACVKFLRPSPKINMADGMVIFANCASPDECLHGLFGRTSLLFQANRWKFPEDEPNLYMTSKPNDHIQVFEFRRRTGGIFSFAYRTPASNSGASGDPRIPLEDGRFWLRRTPEDKWTYEITEALPLKLGDYLCSSNGTDCQNDFTYRLLCNTLDLQQKLTGSYHSIKSNLLNLSRMRARAICRLLFCADDSNKLAEKVDKWNREVQGEAIRELARSLSILALVNSLGLEGDETVTATDVQRLYAIIDGNNRQPFICAEACYNRYREKFPKLPVKDGQRTVVVANRFVGGPMPDSHVQVNRPKNASEGGLITEPSKESVKVVSDSNLQTAQVCKNVEEAVQVLRSYLDK